MKSQQLEVKTNCQTCSFAIVENGQQVGCKANRLQKFIQQEKALKNESGFFGISRFCNMHRKEDMAIEDAYNQIKSNFGIAIFDNSELYFNDAIESCKRINYDRSKIKISIFSSRKEKFGALFNEVNELKKLGIEAKLFFDVEKRDLVLSETEVFQYLHRCSHLIKLNSSESINSEFLANINKSLNDDLEVSFTYQSNNAYCIPFWIVNQQYLNYNSYDLMTSSIIKESIESSMHKAYAQ